MARPLLISAALLVALSTSAPAQNVVRLDTVPAETLHTNEGYFKPPFKIWSVKATDLKRYWQAMPMYEAYMSRIASDYAGRKVTCSPQPPYFLPGSTETAFRNSEKVLARAFGTSQGTFRKLNVVKFYPVRQVGEGVSVSTYVYKPSQPKQPQLGTMYVYNYFFSSEAKQGVLITCLFFPKKPF